MILPSSLTTSGILSPKFRDAAIIPFAIIAQFTIPPKTLTRITWTFGSDEKKGYLHFTFISKSFCVLHTFTKDSKCLENLIFFHITTNI